MNTNFKTVCAWCQVHMSGEPKATVVSHGICKPCEVKVEAKETSPRKMMETSLIKILNESLRLQGFEDVEVTGLSKDFKFARLTHYKEGRIAYRGVVKAETILPIEYKGGLS